MTSESITAVDPVEVTVDLLRAAAQAMRSVVTSPADEVRALSAARNAIDARMADVLAVMDETKANESEGAASVATWAARELRQDVATTRQMVNAAKTMRDLPKIGAAARAGEVALEQVHAFTFSLKHVGHDLTVDVEDELLTLTTGMTPRQLFIEMRRCKAIAHPDELDEAWLKGMAKQDIQCHAVPDGYHVKGFLPIDVGAKLKVFLQAASVPSDGNDDRTTAERRVDGLDELLTKALGSRLKNTNTLSAHVNVIVDAEPLKDALNSQAAQGELLEREPAILDGFGPIGPALLTYLVCGAVLSPILVEGIKPNRTVLDVGRSQRLATKRQRRAIWLRQHGICANRGCHHPIGEVHHIVDWLYGGKTNLSNLAGLCRKCHALVTMGRLHMTGTHETGYDFTWGRLPLAGDKRAGPLARAG